MVGNCLDNCLFCLFSLGILIPGRANFPCSLQHFGAGTFHFACYWALHSILKLEPSILQTISSILYVVGTFLFVCYLQQHLEAVTFHFACQLQPFGSWNLWFCMIFAYICNILELESFIWHATSICKLLLVVGCWLLSVSCGFLFVLLFLLQLLYSCCSCCRFCIVATAVVVVGGWCSWRNTPKTVVVVLVWV